ncbi:hypothetical protein NPN18_25450, partial [Vibrio parahaemolyticus]|nr:hypothetical protein [Vibrio parahaemolyticus]
MSGLDAVAFAAVAGELLPMDPCQAHISFQREILFPLILLIVLQQIGPPLKLRKKSFLSLEKSTNSNLQMNQCSSITAWP